MSSQSPETSKPTNPFAHEYASFLRNTKDHELKVIHDDGLYCHLRMQEPGTRMWSWDVNTWPWHLTTSGDIADGYSFTRNEDMLLGFFYVDPSHRHYFSDGAPSIDFHYWAEKLTGGRSHEMKKYDSDAFERELKEHLGESETLGDEAQEFHEKQLALLAKIHGLRGLDEAARLNLLETHFAAQESLESQSSYAMRSPDRYKAAAAATNALWSVDGIADDVLDQLIEEHGYHELADIEVPRQSPAQRRQELLDDARYHGDSEHQAYEWLAEHEDAMDTSDTWEWGLRRYDFSFILACYAIELTTRLWKQHVDAKGVNDTYILLDGGLVQNNPAAPVFDLGVLDSDLQDESSAADALDLRIRITAHPQARKDLSETIDRATDYVRANGSAETIGQLEELLAAEQRHRDEQARLEAARAERAAAWQARQDELNAKHNKDVTP